MDLILWDVYFGCLSARGRKGTPPMGEVSPPLGPLKGANVAGAVPGGWREAKVERPAALRGAFVGCGHLCFGLQVWMGSVDWRVGVLGLGDSFFWGVFLVLISFFSSLRWWLEAYFSYKDGLGGLHLNRSERFFNTLHLMLRIFSW